jgi:hypothetical protein
MITTAGTVQELWNELNLGVNTQWHPKSNANARWGALHAMLESARTCPGLGDNEEERAAVWQLLMKVRVRVCRDHTGAL